MIPASRATWAYPWQASSHAMLITLNPATASDSNNHVVVSGGNWSKRGSSAYPLMQLPNRTCRVAPSRSQPTRTAMNRLQSELNRLYLPPSPSRAETDAQSSALIDPSDRVRAMVMELTRPPSWEALSRVWHGVQTELDLPAPAIAVSGVDGLQLWFSLAEPIAVAQAHAFLECLRLRYLADIESSRVGLMPASDASALRQELHARLVPARQEQTGNWSAFLAPDLVPVFADSPWLDIPPNAEGQATLLRGIEVIKQTVFEAAFEQLVPATRRSQSTVAVAASADEPLAIGRPASAAAAASASASDVGDPKRFLLQVMQDDTVALALRIEAAKALLQHSSDLRLRQGD